MSLHLRLPYKVFISSAMVALLAMPVLSIAPSEQPSVDGELVVTHTEQSDVRLSVMPKKNQVPFGQTLLFQYGVKAGSNHPSEPAAIVVKVTKVYGEGTDTDWTHAQKTTLYRNHFTFPETLEEFHDEIDRERYYKYHSGNFYTSDKLERRYHVHYRVKEKTNHPISRRKGFLHGQSGHPTKRVAQGSYILSYEGILSAGTWIPFNLQFQIAFSDVYITIIDLGIDSRGDLVEKTWHLGTGK